VPQPVAGAALAHFNLGLALRQKGYHQEALREYRLGLDAGEDRRLNLQAMAEVHLLRRELGAALELYQGLVRDYPDSPKLWNERGVCLHQAGRRAEAVNSYERAVGIDSAYQLAWNNLGVVRAHEAKPDAAVSAFRQALGADRRSILSLVLAHGVKTAGLGIVLGLAGSAALTRYLQTLLFGVKPHDIPVFAGVTILLLAVAILACYIPARRATKIDPMIALRES
jgi:tetratricopeptide (TPR) repeat protein